jgi:putative nucleotidyltransferase with HDIG domain
MEPRVAIKTVLRTEEVPTLPDVVHKILAITGDPRASTRALTEVIERDPALSANLLKLVNSAYFGYSRKVHAVHDAAVLVGYSTIRGMALGTSVIGTLKVGGGLNARRFWSHSLACALATEAVAREMDHPQQEMAFIAGLLHDVGILLMTLAFPARPWPPDGDGALEDPLSAEEAAFGLAHPAAGGAIARAWRFAPDLTRAIEEHHPDPLQGLEQVGALARLVFLGEWMIQEDHPLDGHRPATEAEATAVARSLGYDLMTVMRSAPRLNEALERIDGFLTGMG